jgi:predicted enzyme related to lactoylglutathione lyase
MLQNAPICPTLPAADIERAKKFYTETIGLTIDKEDPGGVLMNAGQGSKVFIYPSDQAGTNKATAAAFNVDDLDGEMSELRSKGVTFEQYDLPGMKMENGIAEFPGGRGSWFKDSEGNIISLTDMK